MSLRATENDLKTLLLEANRRLRIFLLGVGVALLIVALSILGLYITAAARNKANITRSTSQHQQIVNDTACLVEQLPRCNLRIVTNTVVQPTPYPVPTVIIRVTPTPVPAVIVRPSPTVVRVTEPPSPLPVCTHLLKLGCS